MRQRSIQKEPCECNDNDEKKKAENTAGQKVQKRSLIYNSVEEKTRAMYSVSVCSLPIDPIRPVEH